MTAAWALNIASIFSCKLFDVAGSGFFLKNEKAVLTIGMYLAGGDDFCYLVVGDDWTNNISFYVGANIMAARICSGIAFLIGFCLMISIWAALCCGCTRAGIIRVIYGFFCIICCALVGCTFLVLNSRLCKDDKNCSIARGSGLTISSIVLYFISAILTCVQPPKGGDDDDGDDNHNYDKGTPEYAETENKDVEDGGEDVEDVNDGGDAGEE